MQVTDGDESMEVVDVLLEDVAGSNEMVPLEVENGEEIGRVRTLRRGEVGVVEEGDAVLP